MSTGSVEPCPAQQNARWSVMTAEARTDKGKFVNSAWSVDIDGEEWWVVIGFDATMKTVIRASPGKRGLGDDIVRSGELYDFVARVNRQLIADEGVNSQGSVSDQQRDGLEPETVRKRSLFTE